MFHAFFLICMSWQEISLLSELFYQVHASFKAFIILIYLKKTMEGRYSFL